MKLHSNAKLTPKGRLELAQSVLKHGMTLDAAAAASKVSTRTANKWMHAVVLSPPDSGIFISGVFPGAHEAGKHRRVRSGN